MSPDTSWREALDRWCATHHGVVTAAQLSSWGCRSSTILRMCVRGELIRVFDGVYRMRSHPPTERQLLAAACATAAHPLISSLTSCRQWEFRRIPPSPPHALIPVGCSANLPGFVVQRTRILAPIDYVRRSDGIILTNPVRSLFDAADVLGLGAATSVLEQILDRRLCSMEMIVGEVSRLAHPRRPGTKTMRAVIGARPDLQHAMQSDLEVRVLAEIVRQRLPVPTPQFVLVLDAATTARFDFAWPSLRVALEVDHRTWHDGSEAQQRDKRRDRLAAALGWQTVRVTDVDVHHRIREAIAEVGAVLRARGAA